VAGEEKVEVSVAAVIPQTEVEWEYYPAQRPSLAYYAVGANLDRENSWGTRNRHLYLVGSEQLAREIAKVEGAVAAYNWIDLTLNPLSDYNLTVKQCTRLLTAEGASGEAYYERLQKALSEWVNSLILYGMFFVLLTAFFLILRANIIQSGFTFQGDRMKRLRMLGMELRQLRNMNLWQGLYEARWIWLAVLPVYGVKLYQYTQGITENAETGQWWVCLVVLVLMLLLHVLTRYLVSRGAIAALDEKEQEG